MDGWSKCGNVTSAGWHAGVIQSRSGEASYKLLYAFTFTYLYVVASTCACYLCVDRL